MSENHRVRTGTQFDIVLAFRAKYGVSENDSFPMSAEFARTLRADPDTVKTDAAVEAILDSAADWHSAIAIA